MEITDIVSTEFVSFSPDTPVSKVRGAFEDPALEAILVTGERAGVLGVITRRQMAVSHRHPDEHVQSLVWPVPEVAPGEDIREVARLMLESGSRVLPVFEGRQHRGVVTADVLLEAVTPFLDVASVREAATQDLVTAAPDTTLGEVLHLLREHRITHLPIVEGADVLGMLSLHDVVGVSSRAVKRAQGGQPTGFDGHGGGGSSPGYRSHGGFGAREGDTDRILDLPVRDLMVSPVRTIQPDEPLDVAMETMFDVEGSSLVVVSADDGLFGIVTKSDVLEALTWGAEGNRAVQINGIDLLDDMSYDDVVAMVDKFDEMDRDTAVLDAKIHLHEHKETLRGSPLILARLRLGTDGGLLTASGEGYGARQAINEARQVLARRIRDEKTHGRSKKHPDEEFWEKRFGWMLEA